MTNTGRHAAPWDPATEQIDQVPTQLDPTGRHRAANDKKDDTVSAEGSVLTRQEASEARRRWWKKR